MTNLEQRLDHNLNNYKFEITKVLNVSRECHELIMMVVQYFKESVELKVKELHEFVAKEVRKINGFV